MDCNPPGSSVHGVAQAEILEQVASLHIWASLVAQIIKNLPAMQETLVQFLGQEDPLERG